MTTAKRYESVWDAIEEQPEAENLKIRAALMAELAAYIDQADLTQAQAARRLRVTQPRISDLVRGKIDLFSIDALVNMLSAAGLHLDVTVRPAKASCRKGPPGQEATRIADYRAVCTRPDERSEPAVCALSWCALAGRKVRPSDESILRLIRETAMRGRSYFGMMDAEG
jgi:predicted XRE-type DNA-binding protein